MGYTTADLRGLLDDAWDAAPDGDATLRDTLRTFETAARAAVSGGNPSSISKNSSSVSFSFGVGALSPVDVARAWRELVDLFDTTSSVCTSVSLAATDDNIYQQMKLSLVPMNEFTTDFTCAWTR